MLKRPVLCCDGTWNTADQERDGQPCPTDVTRVVLGIDGQTEDEVEQRVYHQLGLGTWSGERLRGEAFGVGLSRDVQAACHFVIEHYEPGDELFLFGFGRGAYIARSTTGLVRNCGALRRHEVTCVGPPHPRERPPWPGPGWPPSGAARTPARSTSAPTPHRPPPGAERRRVTSEVEQPAYPLPRRRRPPAVMAALRNGGRRANSRAGRSRAARRGVGLWEWTDSRARRPALGGISRRGNQQEET